MEMHLERLQKVIAQSGITSRRKAEQMIKEGKVKVNGQTVKTLGTKVSSKDKIEVEGLPLEKEKHEYFLLYKPRGVISSMKDDKDRKVVTDYFYDVQARLFPVGRLDYDSSGLLLMTNDGDFANRLMHPRYEVEKVYIAKIKGIPTDEKLKQLRKGVKVDGDLLKAVKHTVLSTDKNKNIMIIELTLKEGKNRHIRRMFEGIGHPVQKLRRERYGVLSLKGLQPGEYRRLSNQEISELLETKK